MTTYTVNTTEDIVDGNYSQLSLREAVNQANATTAADTIEFAPTVEGKTLFLTGGELTVSEDLHIEGESVTLEGNGDHRFLNISRNIFHDNTSVTVDNLTLAKGGLDIDVFGEYGKGGGIFLGSHNDLTMTNCTIRDCNLDVYGVGGGIFASNYGQLTLTSCAITGNQSGGEGYGGGIATRENVTLTIRDSEISDNIGWYGGGAVILSSGSSLVIEDSSLARNESPADSYGGALVMYGTNAIIAKSTISESSSDYYAAGIHARDSNITILDSTIANNRTFGESGFGGGGILVVTSTLVVRNSTITGNSVHDGSGGGIDADQSQLDFANSIVAGNTAGPGYAPDISGAITLSNGHNVFGSEIGANSQGDRENIAASAIFAAIDPDTGGGQLNASGVVPLRNNVANPALSGGDFLAASATDQLGTARPLPAGGLPDIGSVEISHSLSTVATANNDLLTGTGAANTLSGLGGNDYLKGLGGKDTLSGGASSDLLDGGTGNDKLNGGSGIDFVIFPGSAKVVLDLSLSTDTAKRGTETDTLTSIEGAIGSSAGDTFKGDANNNWFQGGLGKDTFSGGSSRDLLPGVQIAPRAPMRALCVGGPKSQGVTV